MKKFIIFAAVAASAFSMNAQLSVLKSGNIRIGSKYLQAQIGIGKSVSEIGAIVPSIEIQTDSLASMNILGKSTNGSNGYITFGNLKKAGIGEYKRNGQSDSDMLGLFGELGLTFTSNSNVVFSYTKMFSTSTPSFKFNCDIKANNFIVDSDARLKDNVSSLDGTGSMLSAISPISYQLTAKPTTDTAAEKDAADNSDAAEFTPMPPSDRTRYGFIAQEVKEIFPELVIEDEDGYLGVDYIGFIPILVDAYKNLEARVKEQDETIASLTGNNVHKSPAAGIDGILADGKALLLQNRPNPFKENTSIECVVPAGSTEAFICIYDLQGSQVKRFDITGRGNCSVTVDGSSLKPGMYIYALIIDGSEIDSKKMILTD